ncbi:hypothetical protein [Plantactinospora sp. WMMB782]|uniref:hypothetical protein n=1 Tax=Plantactinospora sp. WMMB782 TaxID=3404121 RepID=UPI003B9375DC
MAVVRTVTRFLADQHDSTGEALGAKPLGRFRPASDAATITKVEALGSVLPASLPDRHL